MADVAEKSFILPKIGAKCFGIGIQDICKVSVSYLEPFAEKLFKTSFVCVPCQKPKLNKLSACHHLVMLSALFYVSLFYVVLRGHFSV